MKIASRLVAFVLLWSMLWSAAAVPEPSHGPDPEALTGELVLSLPGQPVRRLSLNEALHELKIPAVGIALIDRGELAWARAFGDQARPDLLYQAASLSKFVTAVGVLRLVQEGRLELDRDVNAYLTSWHIPDSPLARNHPVTLRGLLSMTAGIGVPGFTGYVPGSPIPTLREILAGEPPANSPPVTVIAVPGTSYAYSGGGYEIIQAVIEDVTGAAFPTAMRELVLGPLEMTDSRFAQPLPAEMAVRAARGHYQDGRELPGGWRIIPELAAGGLWSTPTDLAKVLIEIGHAYRGEPSRLLSQETVRGMLIRQPPGPYGLGPAVNGSGASLVMMKRGQNIGYQTFFILFPASGQGMVVMTGSDNGTTLANALVRKAAEAYGWPPLADLMD